MRWSFLRFHLNRLLDKGTPGTAWQWLPVSLHNLRVTPGGFGVPDRGPIGRSFTYKAFTTIDILFSQLVLSQFVQFVYEGPTLACEVCGR